MTPGRHKADDSALIRRYTEGGRKAPFFAGPLQAGK